MPIAYASSPLAPVPVTSMNGVRSAFRTPSVHFSAARSFDLATVSFGSAPLAGGAAARAQASTASAAARRRVVIEPRTPRR